MVLLFLGICFYLTIRLSLAEADFRRRPDLAPDSPAGIRRTWIRAENLARYESSPAELRVAVALNPRLSSAWIQLGLDAEVNGDLGEAETDFLHAAAVDHLYVPAWTLANFYFRLGDSSKFWPWARRAASLTYDDFRPLLRLADTLGTLTKTPAQDVATRLGGGAPLLRAYMDVLIGAGRLDSAQEVASVLAALRNPADDARLADLEKRLRARQSSLHE